MLKTRPSNMASVKIHGFMVHGSWFMAEMYDRFLNLPIYEITKLCLTICYGSSPNHEPYHL